MSQQHATVLWEGTFKEGGGSISTESGALSNIPYSFGTRFEGKAGTNPEELIGAAHAACYTMALTAELGKANFNPKHIHTDATVTLDKINDQWTVTDSTLHVVAEVPSIDEAQFQKIANEVKINCPISRLLNAEISLHAELVRKSEAA